MAFKTVSKTSGIVYTSKMAIGDSTQGHFVGFEEGKYGAKNLLLKNGEDTVTVLASGNLKYVEGDGLLTLGALTRITKSGERPSKGNKEIIVSQFKIEVDTDDMIAVDAPAVQTGSLAEKIAAKKKAFGQS